MSKSLAACATDRPAVRTAWTSAVRSSDTVLVPHGMIAPLLRIDHARKAPPMSLHYLLPMSLRHSPLGILWRPLVFPGLFGVFRRRSPKAANSLHPPYPPLVAVSLPVAHTTSPR